MIPLSLKLKGFLSYRDEVELTFPTDRVLLLSGPNNVGKSSVFDGMLFALFGGSRVKGEPSLDLINHQCDQALVEFEFQLNGERYKAIRSLRRKLNTRDGSFSAEQKPQLFHWQKGDWRAVKGATKVTEFKQWIADNVGLSYEAFTSSVLLLQGKAEAMLDQDSDAAKRRFHVLARMVGLSFYQQLFQRADEARLVLGRTSRELQNRLDHMPLVTPADLEQSAAAIEAKQQEIQQTEQELSLWENRAKLAQEWERLNQERRHAQAAWEEAAALIGDAATIERDGKRHAELNYVLPNLTRFLDQRNLRVTTQARADQVGAELDKLLAQENDLIEQGNRMDKELQTSEQQRETAEQLQRELENKRQESIVAQPWLKKIHQSRTQLRADREKLTETLTKLDEARQREETCRAQIEPRTKALEQAKAVLADAHDAVTRAETALEAIARRAARFAELKAAAECSYCGQPLSEQHRQDEQHRINQERQRLKAEYDEALAAKQAAQESFESANTAHDDAVRSAHLAQRQAEEIDRNYKYLRESIDRLIESLRESYGHLPARLQVKVSAEPPTDWLGTTFPTADDLKRCDEALRNWETQIKNCESAIKAARECEKRLKKEKQDTEKKRMGLGESINKTRETRSELNNKIALAEQLARDARERLPAEWRPRADELTPAALGELNEEFQRLQDADSAQRWERLRNAIDGEAHLRQRRDKAEEAIAAFPEENRFSSAEVEREWKAVRYRERVQRDQFIELESKHRTLETQRQQRQQLAQEHCAADRRRLLADKLCELLGPKHLQRHLLHEAEIQIVANANRLLDKLSGGGLQLRLLPEEENEKSRALQLECDRPATGETRNLAYLSGSERFRVAVSLALGLGQYASRQHRPIECVIIDEGFGCLDRDNRRLMIDEIGRLRGHGPVRSILLISHQEEFADAFPEGFRFALIDDTTRVTPMGV